MKRGFTKDKAAFVSGAETQYATKDGKACPHKSVQRLPDGTVRCNHCGAPVKRK